MVLMKNIIKLSGIILVIFIVYTCKKRPDPPVLTTKDVTKISYSTATSGGDVTNDGGGEIVTRGICWSINPGPTVSDSIAKEAGGLGVFTCNISNLTPNTMYYVRAFATNVDRVGYGNEVSFTTSQTTAPVLTTTAISSIESSNAVSGGNITSDGGLAVTARGICWNTSQDPAIADNKTEDGEGTGVFTSSLTGLSQGTTYFVRAYATNSSGTSYGATISFKTLAPPTVTTATISGLTQTSAIFGGNVTDSGGVKITARGVCWSISPNPTIALSTRTSDAIGSGTFSSSLTGLTINTTYYLRAYATNSIGTSYGNEISFYTLKDNQTTDIDVNIYNTVNIGSQVWFKENLKTTRYASGDQIPNVTNTAQWQNLTSGAWCYYNDDSQYNTSYGKLYNWQAVADTRKVCPSGWHVPSDAEWKTLEQYLGMDPFELNVTNFRGSTPNVGGKLKKVDAALWTAPNLGATDETGFSAIPGGRYNQDGTFTNLTLEGTWWSSTLAIANTNLAWLRILNYNNRGSYRSIPTGSMIGGGFSIRCVKD
jgi:uncharacterized protein (TIGR02145 family)